MSQIPAKGWPFDGPGGNMELEATFPCPEATALGLFASNLQEIPCWLETNISATNSIFEPMMVRTFRWDMDWFPRPVLINIRFLSPIKFSRKLPLKLSMSVSRLDLFQASKHLQFSPGSSFRFGMIWSEAFSGILRQPPPRVNAHVWGLRRFWLFRCVGSAGFPRGRNKCGLGIFCLQLVVAHNAYIMPNAAVTVWEASCCNPSHDFSWLIWKSRIMTTDNRA